MTEMNVDAATSFFEERFCSPASSTYLPVKVISPAEEVVPGTVFKLVVEHEQHGNCAARMYCGLAHHLGGRMWQQEAQSLLRLNARGHPALPRVREGVFRDDDRVGIVLSEATGEILSVKEAAALRLDPTLAFRFFTLAADALRVLHSHGLIHRDIWLGSFELVHFDSEGPPIIRLFGFEMSAFVASLADPTWRTNPVDRERLRTYQAQGGLGRRACRAPEVVESEIDGVSLNASYASDVFALGVCGFEWFIADLSECMTANGAQLQTAEDSLNLVKILDRRLAEAQKVPLALRELLREMLRVDVRTRPTAAEVVSVLAASHDGIAAAWSEERRGAPLLLSIAPRFHMQYMHIEEWKDLSSDETIFFDELKERIEKDLVNGVLIHEPGGAEAYVKGGDRATQANSIWVLLGRRAVYFCEIYSAKRGLGGGRQQLDWVLHVNYVVDRMTPPARELACGPLRRRIIRVEVVHHQKSAEVDPSLGRGRRPSWTPLLDEVRVPPSTVPWHASFRKGFDWWLSVQQGMLGIRQYGYRREPVGPARQSSKSRVIVSWDRDRDQRWIETDELRHLLAKAPRKRDDFGDFFATLEDRQLGELVTWHTDVSGRPNWRAVPNARGRITKRINPTQIELEVIDGDIPPQGGWLRPNRDVAMDILLRRQKDAADDLWAMPQLMEALYQPRSFRGSRKAWEHCGRGLEGRAPEIIKDMLAHFPFYALQGPPGTGKTTVVAHALAAYLDAKPGARVLVSAQSHYALDELAARVLGLAGVGLREDLVAVRVAGQFGEEQVRDELQRYFDTAQAKVRVAAIKLRVRKLARAAEWQSAESRRLLGVAAEWSKAADKSEWEIQDRIWRGANIVFATCGTCTEGILGHQDEFDAFDWVVVEEAAKAWPAELAMPLVLGHRWTLIGDHQQLPPYGDIHIWDIYNACMNSPRPELRRLVDDEEPFHAALELFGHIFERAAASRHEEGERSRGGPTHRSYRWPVDTLDMQFRMHDNIRRIVATAFYPTIKYRSGQHLEIEGATHGITSPKALQNRSCVWFDTANLPACKYETGQWRNVGEADVVAELLKGIRPRFTVGGDRGAPKLAVLSPYHQQNALLLSKVPAEFASVIQTTDSFQGQEAEIVVVTLVRTNDAPRDDKFRRIGHLASAQRSNVLLSRGKRLLVIVGDFAHFRDTLDTAWPIVCGLIEELKGRVRLTDLQDLK